MIGNLLQNAFKTFMVERPGAKQSVQEWISQLENDSLAVVARARKGKNAQNAQVVLRHIIGIERWGQTRLRVFLGEPLRNEEYDGYKSGTNLTTEEQIAEFEKTRKETVAIVRKIASAKGNGQAKVLHNQLGELSLPGWLRYLDMHANWESKKIR